MFESDKDINIIDIIKNDEVKKFMELVHAYAERFHELMGPIKIMGTKMPPQVGRCSKGMPSFKSGNNIFVSKRNVTGDFLNITDFIPVYYENDKLYYYGEDKPSVDTPIHIKLYDALPNIRYILHSHNYIDCIEGVEAVPFTNKSIPCGAIEEMDEILSLITDRYKSCYRINLLGHGSIIMGETIEDLKGVNYIKRQIPERITF
jgi:hypothetical protein